MANAVADWRSIVPDVRRALDSARGVVVLTGAGVSAESGIPTFRDAREGLWARYRPEDLATPGAFERDPRLVWEWYEWRRQAVRGCAPNPAHRAIARLALARSDVTVVTQNVDGLHLRALDEERAVRGVDAPGPGDDGRARLLHLHGNLMTSRCSSCTHSATDAPPVDATDAAALPRCPECAELLRPGVVWFGEPLPADALEAAFTAAAEAELCLVVGTSALVHPAASVPAATLRAGGTIVEVNLEKTPLSRAARWHLAGPAGEVLPELA